MADYWGVNPISAVAPNEESTSKQDTAIFLVGPAVVVLTVAFVLNASFVCRTVSSQRICPVSERNDEGSKVATAAAAVSASFNQSRIVPEGTNRHCNEVEGHEDQHCSVKVEGL